MATQEIFTRKQAVVDLSQVSSDQMPEIRR